MLLKSYDLYEVYSQTASGAAKRKYTVSTAASEVVEAGITNTTIAKHISLDGLGIPPVVRQYRPSHNNAGGIDNGYVLAARPLVWKMLVQGATETAFESARDAVLECFNPHIPLQLKVTTVDGYTAPGGGGAPTQNGFLLDCYVNGPIDFRQTEQTGYSAVVTVPLYAPDPTWWVNSLQTASYDINVVSGALNETLHYFGTWETWPTVQLTGEIEDARIEVRYGPGPTYIYYNIDFAGTTIAAARTYNTFTAPGVKTVVDDLGADRTDEISDYSTFSQLKFHPKPLSEFSGAHIINVYYTSKVGTPVLTFKWYPRYISI